MMKTLEKYQRCSYGALEANQTVSETQVQTLHHDLTFWDLTYIIIKFINSFFAGLTKLHAY